MSKNKNPNMTKLGHILLYMFLDALVISICYTLWVCGSISFEQSWSGAEIILLVLSGFVIMVATIVMFAIMKIYKILTTNFGIMDAVQVAFVSFIVSLGCFAVFILIHYLTSHGIAVLGYAPSTGEPYVLPMLNPYSWVLSIVCQIFLLIGTRYAKRIFESIANKSGRKNNDLVRTMVIGAGAAARIVIDESRTNSKSDNGIVVLVDDDPYKIGTTYSGIPVEGPINRVPEIIKKYKVDRVIIAISDISKQRLREIMALLFQCNVQVKRLPILSEMGSGNEVKVMNVDIEELLGRSVVLLDNHETSSMLKGESVLITGAGGSIGSELVRQIIRCHPSQLILFDIYEHGVYALQQELKKLVVDEKLADVKINVLIGSVYNPKRLEKIFKKYRPAYVYHAAAYKHVPLMEDSPEEAIRSNCVGTYNVAMLSDKYKVKKMVLVSTDKAVRPTNVMGATKRFAEMVIQYFSTKSKDTKYAAVRFGNVLGSNGSVIPLFAKQIEQGGPVLVTDPEITRFFMTIPEAVSLILQCSIYATGGEIFILDMGSPIKILDLAKNMIRQAGLVPDKDIKIEFIGLRPGEKLYEEILVDPSKHLKTANSKIYIEKTTQVFDVTNYLKELETVFDMENDSDIKSELKKIIVTYH